MSGIIPSVSSENLQPTLGVSFGLPQNGPGYGGYAQNPLGTGPAVNPYYTAGDSKIGTDGLSVGPVNFNPLVSFQVKTYSFYLIHQRNLHISNCDWDKLIY